MLSVYGTAQEVQHQHKRFEHRRLLPYNQEERTTDTEGPEARRNCVIETDPLR